MHISIELKASEEMGDLGKNKSTTGASVALQPFGHALREHFPFAAGWRNLNQGSFGACPYTVRDKQRHYQDIYDARPDPFVKFDRAPLIDESREAVAKLINAPAQTVVFVLNAMEGVNTVLRNMVWNEDGKDVIVSFNTIYDGCGRAEDFIIDYFRPNVDLHDIALEYPLEDEEIIDLFRDAVKEIEASGKRARLAIFDVASSNPGVLFPWEEMTRVCHDLGVLSLIDGAQGIGMVPLDLTKTSPDFFISNCHKWLHSPRSASVFHVPLRNQHLIPSSLATARGYIPRESKRDDTTQPLPISDTKNHFVMNFEWVGTRDDSAIIAVKDAIAWRRDVLGGEERTIAYTRDLNKKGCRRTAEVLGTTFLDNKAGTLTNCAMGNVALPLWVGEEGRKRAQAEVQDGGGEDPAVLSREEANKAFVWMQRTLIDDYQTFISVFMRWNRFWVRLSAQVYLELEDYEWAGKVLKELCERVAKREFKD